MTKPNMSHRKSQPPLLSGAATSANTAFLLACSFIIASIVLVGTVTRSFILRRISTRYAPSVTRELTPETRKWLVTEHDLGRKLVKRRPICE